MSTPVITPIVIPNIPAGQSAFQIDGGDKVIVETTQKSVPADPQNVTAQDHVSIRVRVWKINDDGTPAVDTDLRPIEVPVRWESIVSSALADGTVVLDTQLVTYVANALDRARNWLIVRQQLLRIPQST